MTLPANNGGLVAYLEQGGAYVYDVVADMSTSLEVPSSRMGRGPAFRNSASVAVVSQLAAPDQTHPQGQDSILDVSLSSHELTEIVRLPGTVTGYDWSPDGMQLAYQIRSDTATEIGPRLVCLLDARTGTTTLLGSIERPFGTGTGQREQSVVKWSPGGTYVLAVETAAQPSLFVFDLEGRSAVTPRDGTFPVWLSDERLVYQQDPYTEGPQPWAVVSMRTGLTRTFDLPAKAFRPSLAPDGNRIAFDDGTEGGPTVFVYDLGETKAPPTLVGFVAPVWLGPDVVAATQVSAASVGDAPWSPSRSTSSYDLASGDTRVLGLQTTLDEHMRYGVVDVLLGA